MPKKPFFLRSVPGTHIKYAKKMKKFDREVLPAPKSRKSVFHVRDSLSIHVAVYYTLYSSVTFPEHLDSKVTRFESWASSVSELLWIFFLHFWEWVIYPLIDLLVIWDIMASQKRCSFLGLAWDNYFTGKSIENNWDFVKRSIFIPSGSDNVFIFIKLWSS